MEKSEILDKAYSASVKISDKFGVPAEELANYLTAIAYVESTFDPNAKNKNSTARGLTQILINTQRWIETKLKSPFRPAIYKASKYPKAPVTPYSEEDAMYNPDFALMLGAYYLGYNYKRYNNWYKAITAYHLGSYDSKSADGKVYLNKVLTAYSNLGLGEPIKKSIIKKVPVRILYAANGKELYYRTYY